MQAKEYRTVDKSAWAPGPWQHEADKMQFEDPATGLPCLIVRGSSGALCGYVGVSEGHRAFEQNYDFVDVNVHGGLTFARACAPNADESKHICHLPDPGESDHVWWLGFDCAHSGDLCPAYQRDVYDGTYKDIRYVKSEIASLARQLHAMH